MHEQSPRPQATGRLGHDHRDTQAAPPSACIAAGAGGLRPTIDRLRPLDALDRSLARAVATRSGPAVLWRTTIVDDPRDANNATRPGEGKGQHVDDAGNVSPWIRYGPLRNGCATMVEALLWPQDLSGGGSAPQPGSWPSWWSTYKPTDARKWVRGHLLNEHLDGPGEPRNLTPITKKCNAKHHNLVEALCKAAIKTHAHIAYEVEAIYDNTGPKLRGPKAENPDPKVWKRLPTRLRCRWIFVDENGAETDHGTRNIINNH